MVGLKILVKIEELDAYSHKACLQFPKHERHILAAEIRTCCNSLLRLSVRAAKKYYKKTTLQDLDIEVEILRAMVRKAHRLQYIDIHRYEVWSRLVDEIGRMVGGWLRAGNHAPA